MTDVLIIGAGPTGLTLACDLARRGVDVRIVERDPVPNKASRAKTIQPRSLEVLDDLGAVEHVLRQRYLGDVTVPGLDRDHMHIWPSEHGMLGLTPLGGGDVFQFQSPIAPDEEPGTPSLEFYQRLFDERAGGVTLTSATWLSVYMVNVRMVADYRKGRVLLAGDAAHVHSAAASRSRAGSWK